MSQLPNFKCYGLLEKEMFHLVHKHFSLGTFFFLVVCLHALGFPNVKVPTCNLVAFKLFFIVVLFDSEVDSSISSFFSEYLESSSSVSSSTRNVSFSG